MSSAQQGFPPSSTVGSSEVKIEGVPLLANTETPYPLENGIAQLFIKSRTVTKLKYAFQSGNIASGDYWTIPKGCNDTISDLSFTGKIIYIQADDACIVELKQFYT